MEYISNVFKKSSDKNKKAILIGLNYTGTRSSLRGCINDAKNMKRTLATRYNYGNIEVLTDRNIQQHSILNVLESLIHSGEKKIFFQYSGHGVQIKDRNGDEKDGKDEALYSVNGNIVTDDQINQKIKEVDGDTTLIMVIDACHSGTVIDLPYKLSGDKVVKVNDNEIRGNVICISGCMDNQVSMDVNQGNVAYGAMSNSLQKALKIHSKKETTWKDLIKTIRSILLKKKYAQIPQLCASKPELIDGIVSI